MFDVHRLFNRLGSKPQRLYILIASKAVNTDRDIVKKVRNNWTTETFTSCWQWHRPLLYPILRKITRFFEEREGFSNRKTLGSIRAIALDDKMYMLKTMFPVKSRT